MIRHIRIFSASMFLALASSSVAMADGCRAGTKEYSREQIGPDRIRVYCVCNGDDVAIRNTDERIAEVEAKAKRDRTAIEQWRNDLPDYMSSLDEWIKMDEHARHETRERAAEGTVTAFIGMLRLGALSKTETNQTRLDALWKSFGESPLTSARFHEIVRQQHNTVATIRRWEKFHEYLEQMEHLWHIVNTTNDVQKGEYLHALVPLLSLGLNDPRAVTLAAELDFTASALVGNLKAWTARARVDQLWRLGNERLTAMASLSKTYRGNIDELKALRARRIEVFNRANGANLACPG